ncbi:hypothetical protein MPH_05327 [Macrophomina phaseolina MS6]|uniref:DNA recombination and repair protein Rad51-like C-terminal domain-containing protein n=1 Tax=Macrophomina phaseolina (strain MS6) TaxID=1126212 RepID=K2RRY5_MACPH|nr:hypothetical protein MPH_05327 [Macrophomina phaseolina MS6]
MRVFDFLGMVEAVAEVREKLESQQRDLEREEEPQPEPEPAEPEMEQPQPRESSRNVKRIRSTIPDSEDEDESEDDDVMLFDEVSGPLEEVVLQDISIEESEHARGVVNRDQKPKERVGMIMVDNITLVMSPMMKTNYVQASALLTSFLRSLSQVTKTHHLSTIVLNTATLVPSIPSSKARTLQHSRNHMKNPYASIFASAGHLQPALSPILPSHADLHLFITTQPLARQDAAAAASFSGSPSGDIVSGESESVSVLEVLSDRYADRTGRWAAFSWDNAGAIVGVDPQCGVAQKKYHLPGFASKIIL